MSSTPMFFCQCLLIALVSQLSAVQGGNLTYTCLDGCVIPASWVNDEWCDCGNCEDEYLTAWNCSNCECTQNCTTYSYCPTPTLTTNNTWQCQDGCEIPVFYQNDNWCDCANCEDEYNTEWNCTNCECSNDCSIYSYCPSSNDTYPTTSPTLSPTPSDMWMCNDGCNISATWLNDEWCDCPNCEDEYNTPWNCSNCQCNQNCTITTYTYCPTSGDNVTTTTQGPTTTDEAGGGGGGQGAPNTIKIIITRDKIVGKSQMGKMKCIINGKTVFTSETLENNKLKIPKGTYPAKIFDSPTFKRKVILLENVPKRTMIEIHHGNFHYDTTGCILVGRTRGKDKDGNGAVWTSIPTLKALIAKCQKMKIQVIVK